MHNVLCSFFMQFMERIIFSRQVFFLPQAVCLTSYVADVVLSTCTPLRSYPSHSGTVDTIVMPTS